MAFNPSLNLMNQTSTKSINNVIQALVSSKQNLDLVIIKLN